MNPGEFEIRNPQSAIRNPQRLPQAALQNSASAPKTAAIAWMALAVLLGANLPLFLCMPLATDVVLYDMQARNLLNGGVQYREIFETNLPGIVWIHVAVRSLLGMRSEMMRLADFGIFAAIVGLLARWLQQTGRPPRVQVWTAVFLGWFYFSISEWNHCQRDTWMLLPALAALHLRRLQIARLQTPGNSAARMIACGFAEGLLWAAAFWIKPFVAVPALTCWIVSAIQVRSARRSALDFLGLLAGGLLLGGVGVAWLWGTEAWPWFLDTFLNWNPQYVAARKAGWTMLRFLSMGYRYFPWLLLHAAAVPLAMALLFRGMRSPSLDAADPAASVQRNQSLFAAFYLGWLVQSMTLQHLFDYVHTPAVLLALTTIAGSLAGSPGRLGVIRKAAVLGFALLAAVVSPALGSERLSAWWDCVTYGSTPELRDRLSLFDQVEWQNLEQVAGFLRSQNVRDGEVTCYNSTLVSLYPQLGLKPSTRYVFLDSIIICCPLHHDKIHAALAASPQRYLVTDMVESGLTIEQGRAVGPEGPNAPPPAYPRNLKNAYPWSHPVVLRAGRYLVHRVTSPLGSFKTGPRHGKG